MRHAAVPACWFSTTIGLSAARATPTFRPAAARTAIAMAATRTRVRRSSHDLRILRANLIIPSAFLGSGVPAYDHEALNSRRRGSMPPGRRRDTRLAGVAAVSDKRRAGETDALVRTNGILQSVAASLR